MILFFLKKMTRGLATVLLMVTVALCLVHAASPQRAQETAIPKRIVSLSPAVTESLYLLGLEKNVVGVTIYCSRPKEAKAREKVGTIMEPNLEKIMKLQPDLVLAMDLTDRKSIQKMKDLGLNLVTFTIPYTFEGLCDVFVQIGRVTGKLEEAKRLASSAKAKVAAIQKATARLQRPRVLVQIGSKPFYVATKDVFMDDYIDFAGGTNVFRDAVSGSVGREAAIVRNPDVIFIVTMGLNAQNERLAWRRFSTVSAVKNNRIYLVDSDDVCSPTPQSFARSLAEIAALLHPDKAKEWK